MAVVYCSTGSGDGAGMYRSSQDVKSCEQASTKTINHDLYFFTFYFRVIQIRTNANVVIKSRKNSFLFQMKLLC